MSFNVRYAAADDGANGWQHRRQLVADTIRQFDPDLLGTQEAIDEQVEDLRTELRGYSFVGTKREQTSDRGEYVGLFFRSDRFDLLTSDHFWLSETPARIGSIGWDARHPRLVTWCRLRDKTAVERPLCFFNTHFDYQGKVARVESAKLMRETIARLGENNRIILTGDFNCTEDETPWQVLTSEMPKTIQPRALSDSFRSIHPARGTNEATRHDFRGACEGPRIDWILHSDHYRAIEANIDRTNFDGQFPSDHYPATAVLQLR